jgi:adenylate cyclase
MSGQPMAEQITVLAVDDQPANLRLLEAVLTPRGYDVRTAGSGAEALDTLAKGEVDLVLLDIVMPGMDGYQVCRAIRADERLGFLPVVMITASGDQERVRALEAGADDFVAKPFDKAELLARVASLARVKRYHDTVRRQAAELAEWNATLVDRVRAQVEELERLGRLRRFLSPQLAELVIDAGDDSFLRSHRQEIVVVFCDLRGFTPFAEASEPEEVMEVLGTYHQELGELIHRFEGTLERFTGDGLMVFFNDPIPCPDAAARAIGMAVQMRERVRALAQTWAEDGHLLSLGIGIAQGYATLGRIGFEGRYDYAAIGSVTNLAARLCAEARPWQVLVTRRVLAAAGDGPEADPLGDLRLRGFSRPFPVFDVVSAGSPP